VLNFFKPRAWVQRLHLWLTLTVGAFVLLIVATGALLMFRPELEPLIYSNLYRTSPGQATLTQAVENVKRAYPNATLETLELTPATHGALRVHLEISDGTPLTAFIDPGTGQVNGVQPQGASVFDWLLSLHRELLMRPTEQTEETNYGHAHRLVGVVALVLLTLLLSGVVLWFPRRNGWRTVFQVRRKNAFLWNFDTHRLIGAAVLVPLVVIVAVMLPYTFFKEFGQLKNALPALRAPEAERRFSFDSNPIDLDGVVRKAQTFEPEMQAVRVQLGTTPILVTLSSAQDFTKDTGQYQGDVTLGVSDSSGAITSVQDSRTWNPGARLLEGSLYMGIHAGTWGGIVTRVLTLLTALATLYLGWTGVRQWWLKRRKRVAAARG
jgi:uncharacterized iron-regulated membrane protein